MFVLLFEHPAIWQITIENFYAGVDFWVNKLWSMYLKKFYKPKDFLLCEGWHLLCARITFFFYCFIISIFISLFCFSSTVQAPFVFYEKWTVSIWLACVIWMSCDIASHICLFIFSVLKFVSAWSLPIHTASYVTRTFLSVGNLHVTPLFW